MSFLGQIGIRLSGDNSDFKASMEDAGMAAEKFDKQVKKFGLGFGGVAAIATAFRAIVDYARDLENPMDENLKRAKEFALGIDEVKGKMLELGAKGMGWVNSLGEWWGRMYAIKTEGKEVVELAEKTNGAAEAQVKQLEEARRINKGIEEVHKSIAEQQKRNEEATLKQISLDEQIRINAEKKQAAADALNKAGATKLEQAKAELELVQLHARTIELENEKQKKADEEKKKDEEAVSGLLKDRNKLLEERKKLVMETLDIDGKIGMLEKEAAEVQKRINWEKAQGWDTLESENDLMKINIDLGKLREKSSAATTEEEKRIAELLKKQNELRYQAVGIVNAVSNQDQSTEVLQEKAANLRSQLSDIEAQDFSAGASVGGRIRNPFRGIVTSNLQSTERELGLRSEVAANVARYGEQGARRFFGGSLSEFERILKAITPADSSDRTATGIDEINKRLENSGLFPKF